MRILRLFLISAVTLFTIMLLISLLFPSTIRISKAVNIGVPKMKAYDTLRDIKTWNQWNMFVINAPLSHISLSNPSYGTGAYLNSDQLKIIIEHCTPDSVTTLWKQENGKSFSGGFDLLPLGKDSVAIQYYFDFHFRWYPWEKFSTLVYDKNLGPVMEESLGRLKRKLENSQ
jgi:hypothetical protein